MQWFGGILIAQIVDYHEEIKLISINIIHYF